MTVTTVHFDEPINYCDRGIPDSDLMVEYRRDKTSISLVPKASKIDSNMTCYMKNGDIFVFNLKWSEKRIHKNLVVKKGDLVNGGTKILENETFRLFDAGKNYYIENKTNKKLEVNENLIDKSGVISKWSPITINSKDYHL